jgi:hypothetical protein
VNNNDESTLGIGGEASGITQEFTPTYVQRPPAAPQELTNTPHTPTHKPATLTFRAVEPLGPPPAEDKKWEVDELIVYLREQARKSIKGEIKGDISAACTLFIHPANVPWERGNLFRILGKADVWQEYLYCSVCNYALRDCVHNLYRTAYSGFTADEAYNLANSNPKPKPPYPDGYFEEHPIPQEGGQPLMYVEGSRITEEQWAYIESLPKLENHDISRAAPDDIDHQEVGHQCTWCAPYWKFTVICTECSVHLRYCKRRPLHREVMV